MHSAIGLAALVVIATSACQRNEISRSTSVVVGATEDREGTWCVVELTNTTVWPVPYHYGWDLWDKGSLKAIQWDLQPEETRRYCVELDAKEKRRLQFRIRVDISGDHTTQTLEYLPSCTMLSKRSLLETADVASYRFEQDEGGGLSLHSTTDGAELSFRHLGADLRPGPNFRGYRDQVRGVPPPASVPVMDSPRFPGLQRCEQLGTPLF